MNPEQAMAAMGGPDEPKDNGFVPTGSIGLDRALGTGGWPVGRISVIYGPPFCGKTTLALCGLREMQRHVVRNGEFRAVVGYVNLSRDFNPDYAQRLGIDLGGLLVFSQMPPPVPPCPLDFLVVDAMTSEADAEIVRDFAYRHLDVTIVGVSQTAKWFRDPIGRQRPLLPGFIPEASVRVLLEQEADFMHATITRNPWTPAPGDTYFRWSPSTGIDLLDEIFQLAIEEGIIINNGSWYSMEGQLLGQGEAVAQRALTPGRIAHLRYLLGV